MRLVPIKTMISNISHKPYKKLRESLDVVALIDGKLVKTCTNQISSAGICVQTPQKFDIGADARVVVTLPPHVQSQKTIKVNGSVARIGKHGVEILFKGVSPYFSTHLDETIEKM